MELLGQELEERDQASRVPQTLWLGVVWWSHMCLCVLEVASHATRSVCAPPALHGWTGQRIGKGGTNIRQTSFMQQLELTVRGGGVQPCLCSPLETRLSSSAQADGLCSSISSGCCVWGSLGPNSFRRAAWEVGPSAVVVAISQRRHHPMASEPQERVSSSRAGCHIPSSISNMLHSLGL